MAKLTMKFEALKDAKEVFECANGSTLVSLWVQDLDDSKLKLGLTAFDKDGTFTGIRQGDCFEAVAKVGSRKNDYYKLVDKKGGERVYSNHNTPWNPLSPSSRANLTLVNSCRTSARYSRMTSLMLTSRFEVIG